MRVEGSCHCRSVRFSAEAPHPVPFMLCYCSICRKTAGGGGHAINLGARADTLAVEGAEHVRTYRARMEDPATGAVRESSGERTFCGRCGSALWLWDPTWPELVHPHASAIDTDLPLPPARTHIMLASRAAWAEPRAAPGDACCDGYPGESLADWHRRHGLEG